MIVYFFCLMCRSYNRKKRDFNLLLIFLYKHGLNYFFIPFRRVEAISWENFVRQSGIPAVQKRDRTLPGWNISHGIAGHNLWRIYNMAGIPTKQDRNSSRSCYHWVCIEYYYDNSLSVFFVMIFLITIS